MTEAMSVVPAHTNETTGQFCSGGGLATPGGRCQHGCDHADHYANDGHPECEDGPEKWVPEAIAEQEAYLTSLERCEARVQIGGVERDCNRPITNNGQCDRAHAHIEETS